MIGRDMTIRGDLIIEAPDMRKLLHDAAAIAAILALALAIYNQVHPSSTPDAAPATLYARR